VRAVAEALQGFCWFKFAFFRCNSWRIGSCASFACHVRTYVKRIDWLLQRVCPFCIVVDLFERVNFVVSIEYHSNSVIIRGSFFAATELKWSSIMAEYSSEMVFVSIFHYVTFSHVFHQHFQCQIQYILLITYVNHPTSGKPPPCNGTHHQIVRARERKRAKFLPPPHPNEHLLRPCPTPDPEVHRPPSTQHTLSALGVITFLYFFSLFFERVGLLGVIRGHSKI
jgi:hypothetical protein